MARVGVGILTCNRLDSFRKCLESLPSGDIHALVIVNDGQAYAESAYQFRHTPRVIQNEQNLGVCKAKNIALQALLDAGSEYIFLIEDDIVVRRADVFAKYIDASRVTGIEHFSFGFHGPANKGGVSHGTPQPRMQVRYNDDVAICLNAACVGAFCFYTRHCLEQVGLLDERFYQAFDHVEHTYRIAKAGLTTPYWWFADIADSWEYLDEVACSEESSVIRFKDPQQWRDNLKSAARYFREKHGYLPAWEGAVPDLGQPDVLRQLKTLHDSARAAKAGAR